MSDESMEKSALVPRLRFPEFREAAEWKKQTLADVCLQITNGKANAEDHEDGGIYPLYDRSEVVKQSNEFVFDDEVVIIPGEGMRFQPKYHKGKFNLHQRAYALMQHQGNARFVYYTMDRFKDVLAKNAVKSTVLSLRLPIIERFGLAVPSTAEQQKIADCLSSLDELITAEIQKLDSLKTHKKGLMQQLFPREGETVPRLRFLEFREAGEWDVKPLGDIAKISSGGTPNRAEPDYWDGSIPWVTTSLIDFNRIDGAEEFITAEGLKNSSAKLFPAGTLLMAMYGQGKTRGKVALLGIEATTNQACAAIMLNNKVDTNFAFQNLASRYEEIRKLSNEGGQENLSAGLIKEISLAHPGPAEQRRIADCLSSLDDLITTQSQKIDALKTHKKGLMQQLFPVLDEVQA